MKSLKNRQPVLRPQDLVVLLKIAVTPALRFTYASLADDLGMSASEVHGSIVRAQLARLAANADGSPQVARPALTEFVLHGAMYSFPPISGPVVRGMPTAYAGPDLRDEFVLGDQLAPVWPGPTGSIRGTALYPLYPSVPHAAERDKNLYRALSLFDAIRVGAARERGLAATKIVELIA